MPVPVVIITNKKGKAVERADKALYIIQNASLRHVLLRERVRIRALGDLVSRDDSKFFFVRHPRKIRRALSGHVSDILSTMEDCIAAPTCTSRADFEAFIDQRPMDLFEILRLHECLRSAALEGSPAALVLERYGLRSGLEPNSVVPSLRLFSGPAFDEAQKAVGTRIGAIAEHISRTFGSDAANIEAALSSLRTGYEWRNGSKKASVPGEPALPSENRGVYRITTLFAGAIQASLTHFAQGRGVTVPELDTLFPIYSAKHPEIGSKLGTKPLEKSAGGLI